MSTAAGLLPLTAEELLTTTRAVRRRLDFSRPVSREVLRELVATALQAPSGSNRWPLQFVVVTDPAVIRKLGDVYRDAYAFYKSLDGVYIGSVDKGSDTRNDQQRRTTVSADHLGEHYGDAPAIVVACGVGVPTSDSMIGPAAFHGSVMPGMWNFMLAARLRGLGTCWTSVHLFREEATCEVLGIPADQVTISAITPVAYTLGTDFKAAMRPDPDEVIHWDRW